MKSIKIGCPHNMTDISLRYFFKGSLSWTYIEGFWTALLYLSQAGKRRCLIFLTSSSGPLSITLVGVRGRAILDTVH